MTDDVIREMIGPRKHPIQNIILSTGRERFVPNEVVTWLFKREGCALSLEQVVSKFKDKPQDLEQFVQLIGCSLEGFKNEAEKVNPFCRKATYQMAMMKKRVKLTEVI